MGHLTFAHVKRRKTSTWISYAIGTKHFRDHHGTISQFNYMKAKTKAQLDPDDYPVIIYVGDKIEEM